MNVSLASFLCVSTFRLLALEFSPSYLIRCKERVVLRNSLIHVLDVIFSSYIFSSIPRHWPFAASKASPGEILSSQLSSQIPWSLLSAFDPFFSNTTRPYPDVENTAWYMLRRCMGPLRCDQEVILQ